MRKVVQWGIAALAMVAMSAVAAPAVRKGGAAAPAKSAASAPAAGADVPVIETAGYSFCVNEANDAMSLGRQVMVFKRTREQIDADPNVPPYVRTMADDFFRAQGTGMLPSYAHFAAHRFMQCLESQKVKIDMPPVGIFACITRLDIPYFYFSMARAGMPRDEAVKKLETGLSVWQYPQGLIPALADVAYRTQTLDDVRELQVFVLSACLLPPAQVAPFYGMPAASAAPAPAQVPAQVPAPAQAPAAVPGGEGK